MSTQAHVDLSTLATPVQQYKYHISRAARYHLFMDQLRPVKKLSGNVHLGNCKTQYNIYIYIYIYIYPFRIIASGGKIPQIQIWFGSLPQRWDRANFIDQANIHEMGSRRVDSSTSELKKKQPIGPLSKQMYH